MNRHLARTLAMQTLYEWDFRSQVSPFDLLKANLEATDNANEDTTFVTQLIDGVIKHKDEIDALISKSAPEWPLSQISVIDKSILRVAAFELLYAHDVPPKVAIDEAVELGKTFGGDNTSRFVNGVLGTLYRQSDRYKEEPEEKS